MPKHPKRPRDINQLARMVVDIATGKEEQLESVGNPSNLAVLGREGGLKGGKARADKLNPEERHEIAKKAAKARWSKNT